MRRALGITTVIALLLSVAVVTADPAQARTATVTPSSGFAGSGVTVTGTEFTPGFPPCEIYFDGQLVDTCTVDENGNVSEQFNVPASKAPNIYIVEICNFCSGGEFAEKASDTFEVLKPPTTTTSTPGETTTSAPGETSTTVGTTSTTVDGSTTTTVGEELEGVPFSGDLPPLIDGAAIPGMGPGSSLADAIGVPWSPISIRDGLIQLPDVWLLRCGGPPGSRIVDFDDQELGSRATLTPSDDPDRVFFSGSPEVVAPAQGTWTAPHAARLRIPPSPTVRFDINAPKFVSDSRFTYLGLRVGLAEDIDTPVVVELAARRDFTTWWDVDRVELGPERSPATTCLMIATPGTVTFREAHLRVYSESGDPVEVLVDNVYWSHDQRYPIEPDPDPVQVEITYPAPSTRLSTARNMPVIGRVTWPAARTLDFVEIVSPSWDNSGVVVRRAGMGPKISDGDESSAFFWLDAVEVPSGPFEVRATAIGSRLRGSAAVSLEGVGPSSPPRSEYLDLVEGQVDIIPWAIEVTQAVRGPLTPQAPGSVIGDHFNHVAGKRTVVRGYASHEIPDALGIRPDQLQVSAILHGMRNGVTLPYSPLQAEAATTPVFALGFGDAAEARARPFAQNTFNFILPYQWIVEGDIQLRLEVNPPTSPNHIDEQPGFGGRQNSIMQQQVSFTDLGRVGVSAVNVELHWRCTENMVDTEETWRPCFGLAEGDEVSTVNTEDSMRATASDWWKAFPAPGDYPHYFSYSEIEIPLKSDDPRVDVDRTITGRAFSANWENWRNAYWDLACTGGSVFNPTVMQPPTVRDLIWMGQPPSTPLIGGGCALSNTRSAFRASAFWGTAAQEAAHTIGLRHTGNGHGELSGGPAVIRFGGDHGQIDPPGESTWGFDTQTMMVINPGSGHVHDFLSYGGGLRWISVGTWNHLFTGFRDNRTFGEDRGPVVSSAASDGEQQAGAPGDGEALIVRGTVDEDGRVSLEPVYIGDAGAYFFTEGNDVRITLDVVNGPLTRDVALTEAYTHNGASGQSFVAAFPADLEGVTSLAAAIGDNDPTIIETGDSGDGELSIDDLAPGLISWTPGAARPPFIVEASDDGGQSWWMLGTVDIPELEIDPAANPLTGSKWTVRVQGSDGPAVLFDEATIDFGIPAPIAAIGSPLQSDRVQVGMAHVYAAVGVIGDDGSEYQWLIDGEPVSQGQVADVPVLPGEHTITLRVTNEAGSDEHSIVVQGVIDTDGDGLDDDWEKANGFDPLTADAVEEDPDEDGLPTGLEYQLGTDPNDPDTDDDGYSDGLEYEGAGDPLDPTVVAGPIHGLDDETQFATAASSGESTETPAWLLVVLAVALVAPVGYWLGRRRKPTPSE